MKKAKELPKIVVIGGPTSTGKSALAVFLAKKFNGEVISADSRQVYKGMDIGTEKISKKEMRDVPHHLLSIQSPKAKVMNVVQFKKKAIKKTKEILAKGKLPIIAGGTGFWIDAVAFNQEFPEAPANTALRKKLETKSAETLFKMLQKADPERSKNIDRFNKVRLIRALEIAAYFKKNKKPKEKDSVPLFDVLYLVLDTENSALNSKISKRLDQRIQRGLLKEVSKLHKEGVSWKKLEAFGLDYRFAAQYLQGKINDKQKMRELILYANIHYAKRQKTWFKRNKQAIWLNANQGIKREATKLLQKHLKG